MDGNGTIRNLLLLALAVLLLLGGGVSSAPSSSPASKLYDNGGFRMGFVRFCVDMKAASPI